MNLPDRTLTTRRSLLRGAAGLAALGFAAPLLAQAPAGQANRPPPPPGHVQGRLLQVAILRRDEALLDGVLAALGAGKSVPPGR